MSRREREIYVRSRALRVELEQVERQITGMASLDWHGRAAVARTAQKALHTAAHIELDGHIHGEAAVLYRAAMEKVYLPGVGYAFRHFQPGHPQHTDWVLDFLEADPQFPSVGYVKSRLLKRIGRAELPNPQRQRLHALVLLAVDTGRREFRPYCSAARRIDSPELRDALADRASNKNTDVQRRASWMLRALNS